MKENNGWVKFHRQITKWEWYLDTNVFRVFSHLIITANHEDKKWMGIVIPRGSRVCSYSTIAEETSLSVQNVRTSINKLKSTNEVTSKSNNKYTVISINNYDLYQEGNKQTNKRLTSNQQATNNKQEYKNIRNKEIDSNRLEEIAKKYKVSIKSVEDIYEELTLYCKSSGKNYKDYEATLMNWIRRKISEGKLKQTLSQEEELELEAKKLGLSIK